MRKYPLLFLAAGLFFSACDKNDDDKVKPEPQAAVDAPQFRRGAGV